MKLRPIMGILIICLMLQYSVGGLWANAVLLNGSETENHSITLLENTTVKMLNATSLNVVNNTTVNNTTSNYQAYPLTCPKWDDYKDKYPSPITNFWVYWKDLEKYVTSFSNTDDYNIHVSKANYDNNTGYFSGNPISGDMDYRYMPTSELNKAYSSASIAKSRITIPNSLSTSLQATYTIVAVVLGAVSGIVGIITTVVGILTASTAGTTSPLLVGCLVFAGLVVATTIAIGVCTIVIAKSSSGINVESGKIDNRLALMNAELTYRSTMPTNSSTSVTAVKMAVINKTNDTCNDSENKTLNNTTNVNCTTDKIINNINSSISLRNSSLPNSTNNKTNNTNTTNLGNIIGTNDVPPLTEPIPENVTSNLSGTYMDEIYNIDMSCLPEEPAKPNPKWYQFWLWVEYGFKYLTWCGDVVGWGFNHLDSLNKLTDICKHIISDSNSLPG